MHPFLMELKAGLKRCEVGASRLLVAVSGGEDSVALLCGLSEIASDFSLELCVGHYNHRLRGPDSDSDAAWVANLAELLRLPCEVGVASAESPIKSGSGLEENARKLRYQFLEQAATTFNCRDVALAHTSDDQSETVLHHLFRGTGIAGLRGIPAVRRLSTGSRLVRPLLSVRRPLVEDYLRDRNQTFCTDHTNADTAMTRNKLRHIILPLLREQMNPQIDTALQRLAEQANEIDEILRAAAEGVLDQCLKDHQTDACWIDASLLANQPRHLVREMFRLLWQRQDWPLKPMGFDQWNRLATILTTRRAIILPNQIEARFHSENLLVLRRCDPS